MSEVELDPVMALQDLRDRVWRKEEISPEEYMKVLEGLRQHRRAGARVAKSETKSKGKSASVEMSKEEADKLLSDFV